MPSNIKKGNLYENEVKRILEAEGYAVEGQHRKVKYIPDFKRPRAGNSKPALRMIMVGRDIFGCDLIAKKTDEKTLFVQVSTREHKSHKIRQVMAHPWCWDHDLVQLWLRVPGKRAYEVYTAPRFEMEEILEVVPPRAKPIREAVPA